MLKNLKQLRTEKKISQQQLADVIGVSQQSINKYENHNIEPDIDTLIAIADYFNTSVDYLIGNTEIKRKLEKTYEYDLNDREKVFVDKFRQINDTEQDSIGQIIDNYLAKN